LADQVAAYIEPLFSANADRNRSLATSTSIARRRAYLLDRPEREIGYRKFSGYNESLAEVMC